MLSATQWADGARERERERDEYGIEFLHNLQQGRTENVSLSKLNRRGWERNTAEYRSLNKRNKINLQTAIRRHKLCAVAMRRIRLALHSG
jgi:hypothetical protein